MTVVMTGKARALALLAAAFALLSGAIHYVVTESQVAEVLYGLLLLGCIVCGLAAASVTK
jgi:hypothetical protein